MSAESLITIGLFTRPVAFVLSGYMAAAYFMAHFPMSFFPVINMGDAAVFFCFIFLYPRRRRPRPLGARQAVTFGRGNRNRHHDAP